MIENIYIVGFVITMLLVFVLPKSSDLDDQFPATVLIAIFWPIVLVVVVVMALWHFVIKR